MFSDVFRLGLLSSKVTMETSKLMPFLRQTWKISNLTFCRRNFNTKCWKCGIERKRRALFCDKCNMIQNPDIKDNYFKVFEINEEFNIDLKGLQNKYRQLQSLLHPDKFTTKTNEEKGISEEYSSLINKAYKNLQTPINRAVHLLNLKGLHIEEDQKIQDPEFLMEIMEFNEMIDDADSKEKIIKLDEKNKKTMEELSRKINDSFKNNRLEDAKELTIKLKYFTSINNRINNVMRERGIVD